MIRRVEKGEKVERHIIFADNGLMEVEQFLFTTPHKWPSNIRASEENPPREAWDLGVGYRGALRLCKDGWAEGAKDLSNRLETHMPARDKEDTWRFDVAGELPDIGRFLAGDPAHMRRHGHPKGHRPVLSLFMNICASGIISAQQMANYGAAMVAIVDRLEHTGRRVDLSVAMVAQKGRQRAIVGWRVKEADQQPNFADIAFSVAHPASLRRICFALMERLESAPCISYYHPEQPEEGDVPEPSPNTLFLPGLATNFSRCRTLDDAISLARDQINAAANETLVETV